MADINIGATFNDATRALAGGLWQTAEEEGGQGTGSVQRYVNDLTAVQQALTAQPGQFAGDTLNTILADLDMAITSATSGAAAEVALRNAHLDILNVANADVNLAGLLGFTPAPEALPDGTQVKFNAHATFADVGAIFNDFANKSLGGVNAENHDVLLNEANVMFKDLEHMVTPDRGPVRRPELCSRPRSIVPSGLGAGLHQRGCERTRWSGQQRQHSGHDRYCSE